MEVISDVADSVELAFVDCDLQVDDLVDDVGRLQSVAVDLLFAVYCLLEVMLVQGVLPMHCHKALLHQLLYARAPADVNLKARRYELLYLLCEAFPGRL